jgi:hypothetical protein
MRGCVVQWRIGSKGPFVWSTVEKLWQGAMRVSTPLDTNGGE